ncbi:UNVERIFIED_CONTAM: hypothetical protein RMT77_018330 [Armadillidium vulgare]
MKNILCFKFLWIFILCFKLSCSISYCDFSKEHLLCGNKTFHSRCGAINKIIYNEVTEEEKIFYVEYHNSLRNEFATGKAASENNLFFPTAANMEEIVWDEELANMAEAKVKRCSMEPTCDKCRQTMHFRNVGENLFKMTSSVEVNKSNNEISLEMAMENWSNEKKLYFPFDISENPTVQKVLEYSSMKKKNFQKMIWSNTSLIGCAKIAFTHSKGGSEVIFTCYYAPGRVYQGEPFYKIGKPCSKCHGKDRKCSAKYPGLCAAENRSTIINYSIISARTNLSAERKRKCGSNRRKLKKETKRKKRKRKRRRWRSRASSTRPWFNKMALFCFASWIVVFF